MRDPLIAPLAAFSAGILAARYADFAFRELSVAVVLLAALAAAALACRLNRAAMLACLAGFACAGALRACWRAPAAPDRIDRLDLPPVARIQGWVRVPPTVQADRDRLVVSVEFANGHPASGGLRVTLRRPSGEPSPGLHYGDRIEFSARLHPVRNFLNPGSFDRVTYLHRQQIYMTATVQGAAAVRRLPGRRGSRLFAAIWRAREWAGRRAGQLLGPSSANAALVKAMVLGDGAYLERALGQAFQRTGTYHALVVSGSHIALLAWCFLTVFGWLRVPPGWSASLTAVLLSLAVLFVGSQPPAVRSGLMVGLYLVGRRYYRERRVLNIIAAAAFLMLLWDPETLFDPSFQLSVLSVALIAGVAMPVLEKTLRHWRIALIDLPNVDRDLHLEPRIAQTRVAWRLWAERLPLLPPGAAMALLAGAVRLLVSAGELFVVSLCVQVGLLLPMAVYFHRISWSGLSANVFVAPLLAGIIPAGFAAIVTGWGVLAGALAGLVQAMVAVVQWHARLDWLESRVPEPPAWLAWLFGAALAAFAWSLRRRLVWRAAAGAVLAVAISLLVFHPFVPRVAPGRLELTALDVGQGEALFLGLPQGQTMLVDAGGAGGLDLGEEVVAPYLWSRSIRSLDVVVVSHAHADHVGGLGAVLESFRVGELWVARNPALHEFLRGLAPARRRIPVRELAAGDSRTLGPVRFRVLWPPPDYEPPPRPSNDDSLVLLVEFGERRFLLAGDIERTPELRLARRGLVPRLDVLKVPHHGSRTSSNHDFLNAARPWLAVISAGFDNPYRHPHAAVLDRLAERRISVWRTDRDGLVTISTDGRRVTVDSYRLQARKTAR